MSIVEFYPDIPPRLTFISFIKKNLSLPVKHPARQINNIFLASLGENFGKMAT